MRLIFAVILCACPSQVSLIAQQDPSTENQGVPPRNEVPIPGELEDDEQVVEPDHPAVKSPQERALVHLHTPVDICSGVVIAPRLISTAHQCFAPDVNGIYKVPDKDKDGYRVEVASSTLTWTVRKVASVVTPACDWKKLDLAIVVLDEDAPPLAVPASVTSAPAPGGGIQALGFGKCRGDDRPFSGRTGTITARRDASIVVDVLLCQGDVGGGIFDASAGGYLGVVSRRGDSPDERQKTSIVRFDTSKARDLMTLATAVAKGENATAISCD